MTLPPKILWPTALLNTWTIMTFPKSSFYHTNHTFLTSINVWMMDFWSINARIKKNSSAQNTILCREWLLQKLTFHHNEITIFKHSQYPNQRTFGEPPAPSVYIYICIWYDSHTHVCMFAIYKYIISYVYCVYHVMHMLNTYRHLDMPNFSTADATLDRWRRWLHCRPSTLWLQKQKSTLLLSTMGHDGHVFQRTRWRKESCTSLLTFGIFLMSKSPISGGP